MARQSSKDLLERVFYAARRLTDLGRNLSDREVGNRLSAFTVLLPQCFFKALLCFCRERCLRDFADFFGKLARDFAHVIELLRVALAKRAHEIVNAQFDPRGERQGLVHAQGKNTDYLRTCRCEPADKQHDLQLEPAAVLLDHRRVVRRARIRSPFRHWF